MKTMKLRVSKQEKAELLAIAARWDRKCGAIPGTTSAADVAGKLMRAALAQVRSSREVKT